MARIAFDPEIPVFDRYAKAFPQHSEGEPAFYGPFSEACKTAFGFDAHFSCYARPEIPRRLGTHAAFAYRPKMVLLAFDVDGPEHKRTPEWDAEIQHKIRALFKAKGAGFAFATKNGARICYGLKDELILDTPAAAMRWRVSYLDWLGLLARDYQIIADDKCCDWTRLYRLPRVLRDGVPVEPDFELGEPDRMTAWREPYVAVDDPRCLRITSDSPSEVLEPAPVPEDKLEEAVRTLAAVWPRRGRHYASLALSGALARAGWSVEAIAEFVASVCELSESGNGLYDKRLAQARSSVDKVTRGEDVAGWPKLIEHLCTGTDGQIDETRRATAEAAVLAARRPLGQGPPIELFEAARQATRPATIAATADEVKATFIANLADERFAYNGGPVFDAVLDGVASELPAIIEQCESKSKTVDARPMFMSFREMLARNVPPPEYVVDSLITKEGVGALSGEPKSGKSWDATYLAVCVAAGLPVLGRFAVQKPTRVAYFYAEDTESAVKNRVSAIALSLGLDPTGPWSDRLVMQPRGRPLDVMNTAQLCVLAASTRHRGKPNDEFGLMILDPLSNIHSAEEDKRDSMVKVMARLHALEQYLKLAILFVHHSGKENVSNKGRRRGGQKMRGSSAIHGAVDFGIYVTNPRGDGKTEFIARIESEVKAARGAGVFDRTIKIEDNERGNAVKAAFTWAEPAPDLKPGQSDLADDRAVTVTQRLFDQDGPLTRDELMKKIRSDSAVLTRAIQIAIEAGWVQQHYHGMSKAGFKITEKGRVFIRDGRGSRGEGPGSNGGSDPDDPSDGSAPDSPGPSPGSGGFLASYLPDRN